MHFINEEEIKIASISSIEIQNEPQIETDINTSTVPTSSIVSLSRSEYAMLSIDEKVARKNKQKAEARKKYKAKGVANSKNAYFFYPILVQDRDGLGAFLKNNGIDTRVAYPMPLYKQEVYNKRENLCRVTSCPVTEYFTDRVINLPIFPKLEDSQVDRIADLVLEFVDKQ